eukprot:g1561.t1
MQRKRKRVADAKTESKVDELVRWLKTKRVSFENVRLEYLGNTFGVGGVTSKALKAGDVALEIPQSVLMTADKARNHRIIGRWIKQAETLWGAHPPSALKKSGNTCVLWDGNRGQRSGDVASCLRCDRLVVLLFLMYERSEGAASFFYPYINVLPDPSPSALTNDRIAALLSGTPLKLRLDAIRSELRVVHDEMLRPFLYEKCPKLFSVDGAFSFDALLWAHGVFFSRALLVPVHNPFPNKVEALVPFVDSLNHRHGRLTRFESTKSTLSVVTDHSVPANDQMFINYGPRGNGDLLLFFGFVLSNNPSTHITLDLSDVASRGKAVTTKTSSSMRKHAKGSPAHVFSSPRSCGSSPRGGSPVVVVPRHKIFLHDTSWTLNGILLDSLRTLVDLEERKPHDNANETNDVEVMRNVYGIEASKALQESRRKAWSWQLEFDDDCDERVDAGSSSSSVPWGDIGSPISRSNEAKILVHLINLVRRPIESLVKARERVVASSFRTEAALVLVYIDDLLKIHRRVEKCVQLLDAAFRRPQRTTVSP